LEPPTPEGRGFLASQLKGPDGRSRGPW
jgi:hypothetical protein